MHLGRELKQRLSSIFCLLQNLDFSIVFEKFRQETCWKATHHIWVWLHQDTSAACKISRVIPLLWYEQLQAPMFLAKTHSSICHSLYCFCSVLLCIKIPTIKKGESQSLLNDTRFQSFQFPTALITITFMLQPHCLPLLLCFIIVNSSWSAPKNPMDLPISPQSSQCKWKQYLVQYALFLHLFCFLLSSLCVLHCPSHLIAAQIVPKLCCFGFKVRMPLLLWHPWR